MILRWRAKFVIFISENAGVTFLRVGKQHNYCSIGIKFVFIIYKRWISIIMIYLNFSILFFSGLRNYRSYPLWDCVKFHLMQSAFWEEWGIKTLNIKMKKRVNNMTDDEEGDKSRKVGALQRMSLVKRWGQRWKGSEIVDGIQIRKFCVGTHLEWVKYSGVIIQVDQHFEIVGDS